MTTALQTPPPSKLKWVTKGPNSCTSPACTRAVYSQPRLSRTSKIPTEANLVGLLLITYSTDKPGRWVVKRKPTPDALHPAHLSPLPPFFHQLSLSRTVKMVLLYMRSF